MTRSVYARALVVTIAVALASSCASPPEADGPTAVEREASLVEELGRANEEIAELDGRLAEAVASAEQARESVIAEQSRVAALEEDLAEVETELARQITEASKMMQALQSQADVAQALSEENLRLREIIDDLILIRYMLAGNESSRGEATVDTEPGFTEDQDDPRSIAEQPIPPGVLPTAKNDPPPIEPVGPPGEEGGTEENASENVAPSAPDRAAVSEPRNAQSIASRRELGAGSRLGPLQISAGTGAAALSQLVESEDAGTRRLYDSRLDYSRTAAYLAAELTEPPLLILVAQLVGRERPSFVQGASLLIGEESEIELNGEIERRRTGELIREAVVIEVDEELARHLSDVPSSASVRIRFETVAGSVEHELSATEQSAVANVLVAYLDIGGMR